MDTSPLKQLLDDATAPVPVTWMRQCLQEAPYWPLPAILLLQRNPGDISADERRLLLQHLALATPDRQALAAALDGDEAALAAFYPPPAEAAPITTDQAIDTFLSQYCPSSPNETATLEQMIFNPQPEYATVLGVDDNAQGPRSNAQLPSGDDERNESDESNGNNVGNEIERSNESNESPAMTQDSQVARDSQPTFTESLARIYVRQGRYEKAYEIFTQLNLDNPEKSPYFADQLRFLRLLIINSRHQGQSS